jgi:hypothetical protein
VKKCMRPSTVIPVQMTTDVLSDLASLASLVSGKPHLRKMRWWPRAEASGAWMLGKIRTTRSITIVVPARSYDRRKAMREQPMMFRTDDVQNASYKKGARALGMLEDRLQRRVESQQE